MKYVFISFNYSFNELEKMNIDVEFYDEYYSLIYIIDKDYRQLLYIIDDLIYDFIKSLSENNYKIFIIDKSMMKNLIDELYKLKNQEDEFEIIKGE